MRKDGWNSAVIGVGHYLNCRIAVMRPLKENPIR
jgi:hypothetical protein